MRIVTAQYLNYNAYVIKNRLIEIGYTAINTIFDLISANLDPLPFIYN